MRRITSKIICTVLALTAILSLAACAGKQEAPDVFEPAEFVPVSMIAYPVEQQELAEDGTLLMEHSVDTVEFSGGGQGAAAKMTAAYAGLFSSVAQTYIKDEIRNAAEIIPQLEEPYGFSSYRQKADVLRSDETLFVLSVDTAAYSVGAAHGSTLSKTLNFDPVTGETVRLSDIGINGADPTVDIAGLLADKYMELYYYDGYIEDRDDAFRTIELLLGQDSNQWYITDCFVLISNPYDLAPYAAGQFEIPLSAAELEGVVDSKWFAEAAPVPNTRICYDTDDTGEFDAVYTIGNYGYEKNLVWFDRDASNVFLTEVAYNEDGSFIGTTTLDFFAELKAGEALLLDIMVPEGVPSTALSAEIDGEAYTWLIGYNGRDGGLSFMEEKLQPAG